MATPKNQAANLLKNRTPLQVGDASMPTPLSDHYQTARLPYARRRRLYHAVPCDFGCTIAGVVYEFGKGVDEGRFGVGYRLFDMLSI
ncbi:hypothetical protein BJ875DRAFT_482888 [Amylocarpus encephaloides]|uniref:Uncharacterized protein n=1 Tax=Amylocarpus encephaloides TaxID=45428 RepID=A0A9P7YL12_9HELO|nr:hypothetical protein BJ875DRAFT_482888 [Amylocarpus encephaloides]